MQIVFICRKIAVAAVGALALLPALVPAGAQAVVTVDRSQVAGNGYTYELGWDAMLPLSRGSAAKKRGTFWGDVSVAENVSLVDDTTYKVRNVSMAKDANEAVIEFEFDFSRSGYLATGFDVRDIVRLEAEKNNWIMVTVSWRTDAQPQWHDIRGMLADRFLAPPARENTVEFSKPASVVTYRAEFLAERPVAYQWGRVRWNYMKEDSAAQSAFRIHFDLVDKAEAAGLELPQQAGMKNEPLRAKTPWGISAHPMRATEWDHLDTLLSSINEAGMEYLREDITLNRMLDSVSSGEFNFAKMDEFVERTMQSGVGLIGILSAYDNDLNNRGYTGLIPIHKHPEVWRHFVRTAVRRYQHAVEGWVVWNEPDGGFWGGKPNAAEYTSILKIAYDEIKVATPQVPVISGGLESWRAYYLEDMYLAGAKGYFDILGIHRYGPGPDESASVARTMREVREVMAQQGDADIPVWILESGGSTYAAPMLEAQPEFMEKVIRYSLEQIGHPAGQGPITAGIPLSVRDRYPEEIENTRSWLKGVTLERIPLNELATLNPADCPVLIVERGLHIDEVMLEPLRSYVERGGLMVAIGHPPFYVLNWQDENGIWQRRDASGQTYPFFRMGLTAWWVDKRVPRFTNSVAVPQKLQDAGIPPLTNVYAHLFFTDKNLQAGDTFEPILNAFNSKDEHIGDAIALYTYADWKGGILTVLPKVASGWSESEQADYIPRIYLSYLASEGNVERIFIYDMHNDGQEPGEREHNFGLLNWDWSPKPSFYAYQQMTQELGRSPQLVHRIDSGDVPAMALVFRRAEDGALVLAAWATDHATPFSIVGEIGGEAVDHAVTGSAVYYFGLPAGEGGKLEVVAD